MPSHKTEELGFGGYTAKTSGRLMNRDGRFNIVRARGALRQFLSLYQLAVTCSWPIFLTGFIAFCLLINLLFALLYLACGPGALQGLDGSTFGGRLLAAFFFSVHTIATIGYGNVVPATLSANIIVCFEALVGLIVFGVGTALAFARLSKPTAKIAYSKYAVIAPYLQGAAFELRLANTRLNELVSVTAKVSYSYVENVNGTFKRVFRPLKLELSEIQFLALSWTIVHPITPESPLWGSSMEDLISRRAEFLVMISGIDDLFGSPVYSRTSYTANEIVWGAKFQPIFTTAETGDTFLDLEHLSAVEPAALPMFPQPAQSAD